MYEQKNEKRAVSKAERRKQRKPGRERGRKGGREYGRESVCHGNSLFKPRFQF